MGVILPYDEETTLHNHVFINPSGKIIYQKDLKHELYAQSYCETLCLEITKRIKELDPKYRDEVMDFIQKECDLRNMFSRIQVYIPSETLKREFQQFRLWKNSNSYAHYKYSDFMVYVLGYDKFKTIPNSKPKTIITTISNPHVRYYNYYLMDWVVEEHQRKIYDSTTNSFVSLNTSDNSYGKERDAAEEILDIKSKVMIKDRPIFFK